jgi:DNA-binding response OmpR family regulator
VVPPRPTETAGPPLVLVVDGDADLVPRLQASLLERGFRTTTASDGVAATQILRTQTPDAVVLEANLQGVHGFELCQKLRASRRFTETPIILLTSEYRGDSFRRDLRGLFGVDMVMEKPFPIPLLARRLEELLVRSRRIEQRPDAPQQRAYQAFQQGMQLLTENRFDDAIALLQRGLAEDPLSEHLHFQLGNAYRRKAMDLHAMAELERAIELRPDFYPALRNLASLYQERGFRLKSFELWERAMEHCPEDETRRKLREHLLSYFQ